MGILPHRAPVVASPAAAAFRTTRADSRIIPGSKLVPLIVRAAVTAGDGIPRLPEAPMPNWVSTIRGEVH
jgi:hypothetical protein